MGKIWRLESEGERAGYFTASSQKREEASGRSTWPVNRFTIPLALKFPDENGELVMVKSIQVDCAEKKYYCGIPAVEYTCRIVHRGRTQPVRLIFYLEECRWVMEIPEAGLSRSDD